MSILSTFPTFPRLLTHWLPNLLTMSRGVLALLLLYFAVRQAWGLSVLVLLIAIGSDFLDGLAAKHFHAKSRFGTVLDPIADFLLAGAGVVGLYLNELIAIWVIAAMALSAVAIGYIKFLPHTASLRAKVQAVSVSYLFVVWIGSTWAYASLAYGWSWLYPLITVLLLAVAATQKRQRLAAWYGWLAQNRRHH